LDRQLPDASQRLNSGQKDDPPVGGRKGRIPACRQAVVAGIKNVLCVIGINSKEKDHPEMAF
jgi:hypothetical protein